MGELGRVCELYLHETVIFKNVFIIYLKFKFPCILSGSLVKVEVLPLSPVHR